MKIASVVDSEREMPNFFSVSQACDAGATAVFKADTCTVYGRDDEIMLTAHKDTDGHIGYHLSPSSHSTNPLSLLLHLPLHLPHQSTLSIWPMLK